MFQRAKSILSLCHLPFIGLSVILITSYLSAAEYSNPERFEADIRAFEATDQETPPPKGAILCIGSSSMRMWHPTIKEDLAPLTVIPRGFGGSNMNDVMHYIDRVVLPYEPRAIVLYEGDNDTWGEIPNADIHAKFREFVARVHEELPECRIYFVAVKPSIKRLKILPIVQELNDLFEQDCAADERLTYLDVETPMLGNNGNPLKDIFIEDDLHMNRKGYLIWRDTIRPILIENELKYEE